MHADSGKIINGCWDLFIVPNSFPLAEARDDKKAKQRADVGGVHPTPEPAAYGSQEAEEDEDDLQVGGNEQADANAADSLVDLTAMTG